MIAGTGQVQFTKVCTSDAAYGLGQLENLTELDGIQQTSVSSRIARTNDVGVKVETVFSNHDLKTGYYMRTLGLFASDPDEDEILYAVAISVSDQCYMPPNNGITISSAYINLIYAVGNSDNVSLNVDPGCFATIGDLLEIRKQMTANSNFIYWLLNRLCKPIYDAGTESLFCSIPFDCADETLTMPEGMPANASYDEETETLTFTPVVPEQIKEGGAQIE